MGRCRWLAVGFCAALCAQAPPVPAAGGDPEWQRLDAESGVPLSALALDAEAGEVALASAKGVWRGPVEASPAIRPPRQPLRGPVTDLAFLADASLLAATGHGLYEFRRGATSRRLEVGVGEGARDVRRISVSAGRMALATGAGVYLAGPDRVWRRLAALPLGPASLVVLHPQGSGQRLYAESGGSLWRVELGAGQRTGFEALRLPAVPGAVGAREVLELFTVAAPVSHPASAAAYGLPAADSRETALGVVYRSMLALYRPSIRRWEVWRPQWPPGTVPRRYARALERHWMATDRGLLAAESFAGPWRRAAGPLGGHTVSGLAGRFDVLYAATALGAFRTVAEGIAFEGPPAGDPPIVQLQRVVLARQGLAPESADALRRGVTRRGWWPKLSVLLGYEREGARSDDFDQSVVSGITYHLHDRERERDHQYEVGVALAWDLGDVAFDPEQVDVSREARALVQLRGDVLDEITQLYFERQRVLAEASALPPGDPRSAALALRAGEFAARLDGWSGGWFSAQRPVAVPPSGIPVRPR